MYRVGAAILILSVTTQVVAETQTPAPKNQKAVLVTGTSTGIGRKITEKLAADGYFVYAGARKDEDLKALGALKNVQAVRLDVTKLEDIDAAVEAVKHGGRGLYGLRSELAWAGLLGGGAVPSASNTCRATVAHSIKPHQSSLTLYFSFGTRSTDWLHRSLAAYSHRLSAELEAQPPVDGYFLWTTFAGRFTR